MTCGFEKVDDGEEIMIGQLANGVELEGVFRADDFKVAAEREFCFEEEFGEYECGAWGVGENGANEFLQSFAVVVTVWIVEVELPQHDIDGFVGFQIFFPAVTEVCRTHTPDRYVLEE